MLVYLFTDLVAESEELNKLLAPAVERSFNCISIDGDTSTNDTVLLLASGASGVKLNERTNEPFANALKLVCGSLAHQIVDDGEGVSHVVTLHITGARTEAEAKQVAKAIAHSPLCKTAWSSADPNWGRLLAAAGYSGVEFDPAKVNITIGDQPVFELGVRSPLFDEAAAHAAMLEREYTITLDLGQGEAECRFITCDLTAGVCADQRRLFHIELVSNVIPDGRLSACPFCVFPLKTGALVTFMPQGDYLRGSAFWSADLQPRRLGI